MKRTPLARSTPFPPFMGHPLVELAPHVWGITRESQGGALVISMILAERQGRGDVGKYLDNLRGRDVVVEACISERLAGMLVRRGFIFDAKASFCPDTLEWTDGFVRRAEVVLA
jgi:hypothetical protein